MEKDQLERRYRKSPGREYGYDYDPLRSQSGSRSGSDGSSASRAGTALIQRPDPRRTRQLMRQNIIASKRSSLDDPDVLDGDGFEHAASPLPVEPRPNPKATRRFSRPPSSYAAETPSRRPPTRPVYPEEVPSRRPLPYEEAPSRRPAGRSHRGELYAPPHLPLTRELMEDEDFDEELSSDPYEASGRSVSHRPRRSPERDLTTRAFVHDREPELVEERYSERPSVRPAAKKTRKIAEPVLQDGEYIYEEDEELPQGLHPVKKSKVTRRGLLLGAGAVAVGTVGVVAMMKVPEAAKTVGDSVQNTKDAFNEGVEKGTEETRKAIIEAMDNLEGFTLEGAIAAAKLLQGTYDVIVSPVIHFGSELSGDFLNAMLTAIKDARGYLAQVYQDNASLAAIQKSLESWVEQVNQLPKKLDAITDTDLDGAQAYLRALQRKLEDEKKKLHATPTPEAKDNNHGTPRPKATPEATKKAQ